MACRRAGGAPLGVPEISLAPFQRSGGTGTGGCAPRAVAAALAGRIRASLSRGAAPGPRSVPRVDPALAVAALQTVASAVAVAEPDGTIVLVNPALERLVGRPAAELLGRSWCEIGPAAGSIGEAGRAALERLRSGASRASLSTPWREPGGQTDRQVEWELTTVRDGSGIRYLVAAGADVTERRLAERRAERVLAEVEDRTRELERLNDELEQFASIAAHDLREPLRAITGFGDLLRRHSGKALDERGSEYLRLMEQAGVRMNALLDALSSYGRAARPEAPMQTIEVGGLLDEVLASLGPQIGERAAEVTHGDLPRLTTDPVALGRVLQNLVVNALKFNEGRPPRVHVTASEHADGWEIVVRDNGIGIPVKERERIFQMFRRLHARDAYPGTGAGLAIVHRIVERLGGRVWVESGPGGGSEFHVVLPRGDAT